MFHLFLSVAATLLLSLAPANAAPKRPPGYLAPCPGINSDILRPPGSNCLGITPNQCGADKAKIFIGNLAGPRTRAALMARVGHKQIRWTMPSEAQIQDLRPDRLNILMNEKRRIVKIDCY